MTEVVHAKRGKRRNSEAATSSRLYEKRERKDRIFGSSLERARNGSPEARARTRFRKRKEKESRGSLILISKSAPERKKPYSTISSWINEQYNDDVVVIRVEAAINNLMFVTF